jgi:ferredoxin-NADP reductase
MQQEPRESYIVREKTAEAPGVFTLKLSRGDGTIPKYTPGQCITVYFPESGTPEGKAYSISSAPWEGTMNITVRAIGEFSNRLCAMKPGDRVVGSAPLGYFYSESSERPLVMLAGGTGIMPFRSMIMDAARNNPSRDLMLLYSSRTMSDIIFGDLFDEVWAARGHFDVRYFVTREKNLPKPIIEGRMGADAVLDATPEPSNTEFLLCGSIPFVRDMWRGLRERGVPEEALYTEAFFSN